MQIGPLVLLFCRGVLKSDLVQKPHKQVQGQMSPSHWSKVHMAAYKRPATVKVKEGATEFMPHHKQFTNFSLHSVTIKFPKNSENHKNMKNNFHKP